MIDTTGRHPGTVHIARFFDADHLSREDMRTVSQACCDLAADMIGKLDDGAELSAGLRKLLEAKDCFVRAVL
ncbi:hypothetical protein [Amycolatopsis sp. CA-128772]|uniref:hypothetical protein n=1 Tax=Amycolatopsis sp. CA-128772 TaxID=2073159 RepID=UPI0018EB049B|nr:hypothetical protein [Amycolatopsis sp. CA-128772]